MKRIIQPELLDTLPPADPRAIRSRRDLRRINGWMRNHSIMAAALTKHFHGSAPGKITELGAGDGNFLLRTAQSISPRQPGIGATLLDIQKIVSDETMAAFVKLGWQAKMVVTDVFDWSPGGEDEMVIANLFLHHFENEKLSRLLHDISQNARLFIAVEPHRFAWPSLVGPLLRLVGCNDVTRHDAVVSIRAGFAGEEITALWPDKQNWQLVERRAGLFSHLFMARRCE